MNKSEEAARRYQQERLQATADENTKLHARIAELETTLRTLLRETVVLAYREGEKSR